MFPALRLSHAEAGARFRYFTRWEYHDSYRKAFDRLPRDLKAEA